MIDYIETHITDQCNLQCKGCSHFSGLAKPRHKNIFEFEDEMVRLSQIDDIGTIRLMGGEPLLNPTFIEYCRIARRIFPKSQICLVTNGLLLHRIEFYAHELNVLNINVTMSDYHSPEQERGYLNLIRNHSIHEKGEMYNISLDLKGGNDAEAMFEQCDLHQNKWYFFQDGRLYPCCIAGNIETFQQHFGINLVPQKELGIDIFMHDRDEIESFLRHPIKLCQFCRTDLRKQSNSPFKRSERAIEEWTIQT